MQVEVRPIEKNKWHGKKGSESFKRPITLQPLVNERTRQYEVPISPEKLEELSAKLGVDLSTNFDLDNEHPFWDSRQAIIKLQNRTEFFDTSVPLNELKVAVMKGSPFVANSLREYENGLWPEATHYIHNEEEELEVVATKLETRNEAIRRIVDLTLEEKAQIVLLLAGKMVKGRSQTLVDVELNKIIESDPKKVLHYIERDKELNSTEALVLEAINKSVLVKKGHRIMYFEAEIGTDVSDAANYLNKAENQQLKLRIMEAVE